MDFTKELYPMVATKYETTPSGVERAMRHAIDLCWRNNSHLSEKVKLFGSEEKPSVSHFIAAIKDDLELKWNEE